MNHNDIPFHCFTPIQRNAETQADTPETVDETQVKRSSLKAAAFKILERNRQRNARETIAKKQRFTQGNDETTKRNATETHRRPYRFVLRDDLGGGVYLTSAPNIESAWNELHKLYGDRLVVVMGIGQ